uniref:Uncharacterized protein n=1 Tax=Strongyloides stercoralis TaxID=6248 RepID=A0A0K0E7B9_STRER
MFQRSMKFSATSSIFLQYFKHIFLTYTMLKLFLLRMDINLSTLTIDELVSLYKNKQLKNQVSNEWDDIILNQLRIVIIYCLTKKKSKNIPKEFLRLDHNGIKNVFIPPIVKGINGVKFLQFIEAWYNYNATNRLYINEILKLVCLDNIVLEQLYSFTKKSIGKMEENGDYKNLNDFQKFLIMLNLEVLNMIEEKKKMNNDV